MKKIKADLVKKWVWYLLLFLAGLIFLLFYSISTSPFTSNSYGTDSAFFQMVGQHIKKGTAVMYKDIFDTKGPYLFMIQYLGQLLSYGRYGLFCIQTINLFCILLTVEKTYWLLSKEKGYGEKFFIFAVFFVIFSFTIDCGNLTEEYSLLPLFFSMYLFFGCLIKGRGYNVCFGFMGGIFGFLAFIRLTNAGFICVLASVLFLELFFQRKIWEMVQAVVCFLLGVGIAAIPVCLYYASKDALSEMLYAVFVFGFQYAVRAPGKIRYGVISILFVSAAIAGWFNRKERPYLLFSILSVVETVMIFLLGNGYIHYYQLILPPVLGNLFLILRKRRESGLLRIRKALLVLGVLVLLANGKLIITHGGRVVETLGLNTPEMERSLLGRLAKRIEVLDSYGGNGYRTLKQIEEIKAVIPPEASVFNYETRPIWLLATAYIPYHKYCETQDMFIQCNPEIADEIDQMFEQAPPDYVVTEKFEKIKNTKVLARLQTMYYVRYSNERYVLYERKIP